jgi:predicted  nucleic acid-binding Zn-ribbon protein
MRNIVEKLMEMQELELVVHESEILHKSQEEAGTKALRKQIDDIAAEIPPEPLQRYRKLRSAGLAVVDEEGGICLGCRLNIPRGDLNRMRTGKAPWMCPNCSKFLLLSE